MTADKHEVRKLAHVLREGKYMKLEPEALATYLLTHGYSRTLVAFEEGLEHGLRFEAAVEDALTVVSEP